MPELVAVCPRSTVTVEKFTKMVGATLFTVTTPDAISLSPLVSVTRRAIVTPRGPSANVTIGVSPTASTSNMVPS